MRSHCSRGFTRARNLTLRSYAIVMAALVAVLVLPSAALAAGTTSSNGFHPVVDIPQLLGVILFIVAVVALALLVHHAAKSHGTTMNLILGAVVLAGFVGGIILIYHFGLPSFSLRRPSS